MYFSLFLFKVRKNFDRAEEIFCRGIQRFEKSCRICSYYGEFLVKKGKFEEGRKYLENGIDEDIPETMYNYAMFLTKYERDKVEEINQTFQKSLEKDSLSWIYFDYIKFLIETNDFEKARLYCEKMIQCYESTTLIIKSKKDFEKTCAEFKTILYQSQ